ncbi:MAG TPA: amidohydrolase family protein [Pyrinomonadaceae bacterium]|nr:amidohydrolase family protein [Pyrinomonadaceae bacterium]
MSEAANQNAELQPAIEAANIMLYCADWVLPITSQPIADGALAVAGERLIAVDQRAKLEAAYPHATRRIYPDAVIIPGLVNSHSHLELSVMRGYLEVEEGEFFAWLRKLTRARLDLLTPDDLSISAAWGAIEAARAGITCVGDASDNAHLALRAVKEVGLRGIVYQEVFGPDARTAGAQFEKLREKISVLREMENNLARAGVSPHAPYTVSGPLLQVVARYAREENLPLMMHAAESLAEKMFVRDGTGPFAENLQSRNIEWRATGLSSIAYLAGLGVLESKPLFAHCVTVDERDLELIVAAGAKIAHCPKSNAKLGHGAAPLIEFLRSGVTFGLGSDSVASNNTVDLIEEARFALLSARARAPRTDLALNDEQVLNASRMLAAATLGGARALFEEINVNSLVAGQFADFAVVSLGGAQQLPVYDPVAALIFASSGRDVLLTVVAGREIYREGRMTTTDEERVRARVREIGKKLGAF